MDIELLKTFLEVKTTRHFGKAAENLYITQAAVSARVKQLEEHFGVELFIRKRNNIQLTAEGERLIPHAESMLLAWQRVKLDVAHKAERQQQISIGATAGLWNYAYQGKLPTIYKALPSLTLRSEVQAADDLIRMVLDGALDIAILFDAPSLPECVIRNAGKLKLVLASTVADVNLKQAVKENYIYVDWGTAFNMFHLKRFGDAIPYILYTSMASIAEAFMKECGASAYLPMRMIESSDMPSLQLVANAPSFSREINIIFKANSEKLIMIEQLLPLIQA